MCVGCRSGARVRKVNVELHGMFSIDAFGRHCSSSLSFVVVCIASLMDPELCSLCGSSFADVERSLKRKSVCQKCWVERQKSYKQTHKNKVKALEVSSKQKLQKPKTFDQAMHRGLLQRPVEVPVPAVPTSHNRNAEGVQKGQETCLCGAVKWVDNWGRYVAGTPTGRMCRKCATERDNASRNDKRMRERAAQEEARTKAMSV